MPEKNTNTAEEKATATAGPSVEKTTQSEDSIQTIALLKIPPFWNNRPDLWFLQVETQFRLKGITTSGTKYDYVVAHLPIETVELIADILKNPPTANRYETLKEQLLSRSQDSEERRLDALLHKMDLGDSKPSDLYRQMESLAGGNSLVNDSLLKKLWINKLPSAIQACLITIEATSTKEQLFTIADKIHDATTATRPNVSAVSQSLISNDSLLQAVKDLKNRVERLAVRRPRSRDRNSFRKGRFTRKPTPVKKQPRVCWYHERHGRNANKCNAPCSFLYQGSAKTNEQKNE